MPLGDFSALCFKHFLQGVPFGVLNYLICLLFQEHHQALVPSLSQPLPRELRICSVVESFCSQMRTQGKHLTLAFPEFIQKQYYTVTVLAPSCGLLTQKILKCFVSSRESPPCCLTRGDCRRRSAANEAFSEHSRMEPDVRV